MSTRLSRANCQFRGLGGARRRSCRATAASGESDSVTAFSQARGTSLDQRRTSFSPTRPRFQSSIPTRAGWSANRFGRPLHSSERLGTGAGGSRRAEPPLIPRSTPMYPTSPTLALLTSAELMKRKPSPGGPSSHFIAVVVSTSTPSRTRRLGRRLSTGQHLQGEHRHARGRHQRSHAGRAAFRLTARHD